MRDHLTHICPSFLVLGGFYADSHPEGGGYTDKAQGKPRGREDRNRLFCCILFHTCATSYPTHNKLNEHAFI